MTVEVKITKAQRRILEAIADGWKAAQYVDRSGRKNYMTRFTEDGTTKDVHTATIRNATMDALYAKRLVAVDWPKNLGEGDLLYYVLTESGRKLVESSR